MTGPTASLLLGKTCLALIFFMNALGIVDQAKAGHELVAYGMPASLVPLALRMAQGFHGYELIDGTLRAPENLTAIAAEPRAPFNPGAAAARLPAATTVVA